MQPAVPFPRPMALCPTRSLAPGRMAEGLEPDDPIDPTADESLEAIRREEPMACLIAPAVRVSEIGFLAFLLRHASVGAHEWDGSP